MQTDSHADDLDLQIAWTRVVLGLVTVFSIYVDPSLPTLTRWLSLTGGMFVIDPHALTALLAYVGYGLLVVAAVRYDLASRARLLAITPWLDLTFATAIAIVSEGETSPSMVFFVFSVLSVSVRAGFRETFTVAVAGAAFYLLIIVASSDHVSHAFFMRAAYLAITGYAIGRIGQQRLKADNQMRRLDIQIERHRIAQSIHDGYAQSLLATNLRLESCRQLLRLGRSADVAVELTDIQVAVLRESDDVRAYLRSLVDDDAERSASTGNVDTQFEIRAEFSATSLVSEQVLAILLEGLRNVIRHAQARLATLAVTSSPDGVRITLDDDGIGFPPDTWPPWSISSRVEDLGGTMTRMHDDLPGAHVSIDVPRTSLR